MKYRRYKTSELSTKISDGLHSTPVYTEDWDYYFVNGNNIVNWKIVYSINTKRVDESEYQRRKRDLTLDTILMSINWTIWNLDFTIMRRLFYEKVLVI